MKHCLGQSRGRSRCNAGNYGGDASGSTVDRSAVQWLKLSVATDGSGLSYLASGRIFDSSASNPLWFYFPSQAPNCANDVVFGCSGSSANVPVSAYFSWLPSYQAVATTPQTIKAGTGSYYIESWGDYSTTVIDPTDDLTFWSFQEYTRVSTGFGTWIQKISQTTNPPQ